MSNDDTVTRECPFPDCDWSREHTDDYEGRLTADYRAEHHYSREHAGRVAIQITLEAQQQLGDRDPSDIRERYLEEYGDDKGPFDVAYVRTEVLEEPDDHNHLEDSDP